ncbi:integrator complex subunit 2, partial [Elysia marginata]
MANKRTSLTRFVIPLHRLRLLTVNALQPVNKLSSLQSSNVKSLTRQQLTEQDLVVDPLVVLRCDERIF